MIGKSVSSLVYEDVRSLTESTEVESVMLDYKKTPAGTDREKGELAKDISAFANSQGGFLVIGVEEKDEKPVDLRHHFGEAAHHVGLMLRGSQIIGIVNIHPLTKWGCGMPVFTYLS
jgi:predicted HTH transcriptional regulator